MKGVPCCRICMRVAIFIDEFLNDGPSAMFLFKFPIFWIFFEPSFSFLHFLEIFSSESGSHHLALTGPG